MQGLVQRDQSAVGATGVEPSFPILDRSMNASPDNTSSTSPSAAFGGRA
jgi:hypothetical protein